MAGKRCDGGRRRGERPSRSDAAGADAELQVFGAQLRPCRAAGDLDDYAVDALVEAGEVDGDEGAPAARQRQQRLLVPRHGRQVGRVGGGVLAVEGAVVVEELAGDHRGLVRRELPQLAAMQR